MTQTNWLRVILPGIAITLAGCSSATPSVRFDVAKTFHASKYKTYHLIKHPVAKMAKMDTLLSDAVHRTMRQKGYVHVPKANAATYVSVKVLLSDDPVQTDETAALTNVLDDDRLFAYPGHTYHDKTMIVMLQDSRTHQVVWAGWSQMQVAQDKLANQVSANVTKILQMIPKQSALL